MSRVTPHRKFMYILADIGGTKMRIAGSADLATFGEPTVIATPQKYDEGISICIETAKKIAGSESITAIAAGVAGLISKDRRSIERAKNLQGWGGKPLTEDLEKALGGKVYLGNDVEHVGLGEAVFGAGKGAHIVMYMTVSTGVNAIRTVEGRIEPYVYGAETGFQYLSINDQPVDLMDLISGNAITQKYGKHPKELGKDHPIWEELARYTAFGVHNSILHWSPDRVVLGGSMFNDIGISVERVEAHLKDMTKAFPQIPEIVHSSLGDLGGLWGGMALLKEKA